MNSSIKIDPRTKLFIIFCLSSLGVFISNNLTLAIILIFSFTVALCFKINLWQLVHKLRKLFVLIFIIAITQSIFTTSGNIILSYGQIVFLTTGGLEKAFEFILRMLIIISSAAIISTSSYREIIQGLVLIKLPYEIAFMASMGIRFMPMLIEGFTDASVAIQLRGVDIKKIKFNKKVETYLNMLNPVIMGSLIKAHWISISIESRGFRTFPKRTSFLLLKMKAYDFAIMIGIFLFSIVIITRN